MQFGCPSPWPVNQPTQHDSYADSNGVDIGAFSGSVNLTAATTADTLFSIRRPPPIAPGLEGMASVHVDVFPGDLIQAAIDTANSKVVLDVMWQTGRGGGTAVVEAQHGTVFTVGGATALTIKARLEAYDQVSALVVARPVRVEASARWMTSINPKAARRELGLVLAAGVASAFVAIPKQSDAMIVYSTVPADLIGMTAELATTSNAATIRKTVINPNANGTSTDGVDFVRLTAASNSLATLSFELYL